MAGRLDATRHPRSPTARPPGRRAGARRRPTTAETEQGDVTRLEHVDPPEWRLRVGDWRVRFVFNYSTRTIDVLRVLPRGRAFRD